MPFALFMSNFRALSEKRGWSMKKLFLNCIIGLLLIQSCGFYGRRRGPTDWHRLPKPDFTIPPQAQYLKGLRICLDPGHGGDAHIPNFKRGPTGVREAEINLRVALLLQEYLERSGVIVIMTRNGDYEVDLKTRAEIAALNQADIFISLHHNSSTNPQTNYSSTWYHRDADHSPASLDLARYIQQSLEENLRLPQQLPTGLLADYLMYPNGFSVLRFIEMPGLLVESSFFSHPREEKLLKKPAYNRLEAYAIYLGIVRWAAAGIPNTILIEPRPDTTITNKQPTIYMKITDGLHERPGRWMLNREQYFSRQVTFFLDDSIAPFILDRDQNLLIHNPEKPLFNGWHTTQAEVTNYLGNHNLPRKDRFRIASPARYLFAKAWNERLPADGKAFTGIDVLALDADSLAVADQDTVRAVTNRGQLQRQAVATSQGLATFYLQADRQPDFANLNIFAGNAKTNLKVSFVDTGATLVAGFCRSEIGDQPIANVLVTLLPDSNQQIANTDGIYYYPQVLTGDHEILFQKYGYFCQTNSVIVKDGQSNIDTVRLRPVFGAVLHNFVLVIDPRFGGKETGVKIDQRMNSAQVNLKLSLILKSLLEQAGAQVYLTRDRDLTLKCDQRIKLSNQFPEGGYYLRLNLDNTGKSAMLFSGGHYPGREKGKNLLKSIADRLTQAGFADKTEIKTSNDPEIRLTNRASISIDIHLNPADSHLLTDQTSLQRIAWEIFTGFIEELGGEYLPECQLTVKVTTQGKSLSDAEVRIGSLLTQMTDQQGTVVFEFIEPGEYIIEISHPIYGKITKSFSIQNQYTLIVDIMDQL